MTEIEVFADVGCPFTHVGLRRFVDRRAELDRTDIGLRIRSWPLEIVNGVALDPHHIAEEVAAIRAQVAPQLFRGFAPAAFPASSLPALDLAAAAYAVSQPVGEEVSLELRDLLFEQGVDIADPDVLLRVAVAHGVTVGPDDRARVLADHAEGVERGVIGSPHFFTPDGGFFCPSLDVHRDANGHFRIELDRDAFDRFMVGCFR